MFPCRTVMDLVRQRPFTNPNVKAFLTFTWNGG